MSYTTSYTAILLALTLTASATAKAQQPAQQAVQQTPSTFTLTLTLSQDIVDFTVDNLGNIYVLNSDNQLKKLGPRGTRWRSSTTSGVMARSPGSMLQTR